MSDKPYIVENVSVEYNPYQTFAKRVEKELKKRCPPGYTQVSCEVALQDATYGYETRTFEVVWKKDG